MVLSQPDLRRAIQTGRIKFDPPLEENQWGQASIDLRLGFSFTRLKSLVGMKVSIAEGLGALAASGFWDTMVLKEFNEFGKREAFDLGPGEFVLAFTHEKVVVPESLIGLIEGRTTYARVGLSMHHTAPWIQPGFAGPIVLEMINNGPLTIVLTPLIDRPCQPSFLKLSSRVPTSSLYGAQPTDVYQDQVHPIKLPLKDAPAKRKR